MEFSMNEWNQDQINYDSTETSGLRYHLTSFVLHVLFVASALLVGSLMPTPIVPPITEFTILDSAPGMGSAPETQIATSPNPSPKAEPEIAPPAPKENLKWDQDTVVISKPIKPKPTQTKSVAKKSQPKVAHPKSYAQKKVYQGPTVKESELEAPVLETDEFEKSLKQDLHYQAKKFDDSSLQEEIRKIDKEQETKVAALQNELDSETNHFLAEQEEDLNALEADKNATNKMLKANAEKMKAGEASKIAAAQAAEKAAAERAAAAAYAAQKAAEARAAQNKGNGRGQGAGNMVDGESYGVNGPIRSLEDIRQMPGNKRPQYDNEDRFQGRQGEIAFLAFVSSEGRITELKLIKATGHRTLDSKTLKAIRDWKFYPGQEGWVEIPFRWDLKGGPQEMPTTLRRKISQR